VYGLLIPAGVDPATVEVLERFAGCVVDAVANAIADATDRGDNAPPTDEDYESAEESVNAALGYFLRYEIGEVPATPLRSAQRRAGRAKRA
jgi:hypothetical protein